MVALIIAREFVISAFRSVAASSRVVLGAIFSAKVKTVTQVISISLLIIYNQLGSFERLAPLSLWVAMLVSVYSAIEYLVRFGPTLFGGARVEGTSGDS